jgi:hypothetical protein
LLKKKSRKEIRTGDRSTSQTRTSTTFAPVFKFIDHQGKEHEVEGWGSNPPAYSVNEKVNVRFLKEDPQQAKLESFIDLWGAATVVGGTSIVFCLFGIFFVVLSKR